jgi:hypothetical protein
MAAMRDDLGPDDLLARLRERAGDDDRRTEERGDAFTEAVGALPIGELFDALRAGGAALRELVASHAAPTPSGPAPTLAHGFVLGGMDVATMVGLAGTPAATARRAPATAADVASAEAALGLRLPPLLVRIYREVADGGFGPGGGLLPLLEGLAPRGDSLVEAYESICDASEHGYGAPWPRHLLPIASWSDGALAVIDTEDPALPVREVDYADVEEDDEDATPWVVDPVSPSLAEWLRRWVDS